MKQELRGEDCLQTYYPIMPYINGRMFSNLNALKRLHMEEEGSAQQRMNFTRYVVPKQEKLAGSDTKNNLNDERKFGHKKVHVISKHQGVKYSRKASQREALNRRKKSIHEGADVNSHKRVKHLKSKHEGLKYPCETTYKKQVKFRKTCEIKAKWCHYTSINFYFSIQ